MVFRTVLVMLLGCGWPPSLAQQQPSTHPLFDGDMVHEIRLTFSQPDWKERLRANFEGLADPVYLEAGFEWGDTKFEKIGIRYKGNSSYRSYPGDKKSFRIKTNEFVKGQKVDGIDSLNLHNAFKDPTFVRERAYYEAAAALGLPAPRVNYAALFINGEYWGLYFLVEGVDSAFLESRFGKKEKGNLYKGDPRGTLQMLPNAAEYERAYEKENNEDENDWTDLIKLIETVNRRPASEWGAVLDTESAASLLALDLLTANLDSYIGSGHNYYLYHRQSDDRFVMFPWDPNEAWGNFNMGMSIDQLKRLPLQWTPVAGPAQPGPGQPPPPGQPGPPPGQPGPPGQPQQTRPLASRLWADPDLRALYRAKLKALNEGPLHPDTMAARMTALRDLVRPWVERDTKKMYPTEVFESAFGADYVPRPAGPPPPGAQPPNPVGVMPVPGLEPFLRQRSEFVAAELAR